MPIRAAYVCTSSLAFNSNHRRPRSPYTSRVPQERYLQHPFCVFCANVVSQSEAMSSPKPAARSELLEGLWSPQLLSMIIGHLDGDRNALAACNLVCKAWVQHSRPQLWRTIKFGRRRNDIPVGDIRKHPGLATLIQALMLFDMDHKVITATLAILPKFTSLKTLEIVRTKGKLHVPRSDTHSSTVARLAVSDTMFHTFAGWHKLVTGFSNLRDLCLSTGACVADQFDIEADVINVSAVELKLKHLLLHMGDASEYDEPFAIEDNYEDELEAEYKFDGNAVANWLPNVHSIEAKSVVLTGTNAIPGWFEDSWTMVAPSIEELRLEMMDTFGESCCHWALENVPMIVVFQRSACGLLTSISPAAPACALSSSSQLHTNFQSTSCASLRTSFRLCPSPSDWRRWRLLCESRIAKRNGWRRRVGVRSVISAGRSETNVLRMGS